MRGLAARRRAHVQHPRTRGQPVQQGRHALRGAILHRHIAVGEAGQARRRHRSAEQQRVRHAVRNFRLDARVQQPLPIGVTVAAQPVDPQPQWRLLLAGGEDVIGLRRPVLAHLLSQPCRPQGIGRRRRQALALRASQQRIDQLVLVGAAQSPHGLDGGRQRRMGRQAHHHHLGEAHMQQRAQFVLAASQRLGHPGREGGVAAGTRAQHRETDRLEQRAIAGVLHPGEIGRQFGLQRAAAMHHRIDHTGRDDPHRDARLGGHGVTRSRRALR